MDLVDVRNQGGELAVDFHTNVYVETYGTSLGFQYASTVNQFQLNGASSAAPEAWDPNAKWMAGDFDGDGHADLAKAYSDSHVAGTIDIDVYLGTGNLSGTGPAFIKDHYAYQQGGIWNAMYWFAADFNQDGRTDFAKAFGDSGGIDIDLHLSE